MLDFRPAWSDSHEQVESLPAALAALLRAHRATTTEADVHLALGLPFVFYAADDEPDVARFATLARDFALAEAAALFGCRLRPLHSRATADTLCPSPEFAMHFRDSYMPLILRALVHDQPVIAWQGWPPPAQYGWGLITHTDDRTGLLHGFVAGHAEQVPLTAPALQCYVVEEVHPATPAPAELLTCAAAGVARLHEECADHGARVVGAFAWRMWSERMAMLSGSAATAKHLALAESLAASRAAGAHWLECNRPALPPAAGDALRAQLLETVTHLQQLVAGLRIGAAPAAHDALLAAADADRQCQILLQRVLL